MSHQDCTFGYMGVNYQRLYVHFDSITKQSDVDYKVYGKMKYRDSIFLFKGEALVVSVVENVELVEGLDGEGSMQKCEVKSDWLLHVIGGKAEEKGDITGSMISYFDMQTDTPHFFDYNLSYCDGFRNNQFVGEYKDAQDKQITQSVCWGAFRIPNCGDLDVGAGEFSPNEKYLPYGWRSYYEAQTIGTEDVWQIESLPWWKGESRSIIIEF